MTAARPQRLSEKQVAIVAAFLRGEAVSETTRRLELHREKVVYRQRDMIRRKVLLSGEAVAGSSFSDAVEEVIRLGLFSRDGTPADDVLERAIGRRHVERERVG